MMPMNPSAMMGFANRPKGLNQTPISNQQSLNAPP